MLPLPHTVQLGVEGEPWVRALCAALGTTATGSTVRPEILSAIAVLEELELVCVAVEQQRKPPNTTDRRTLAADIEIAFGALGRHARRAVESELNLLLSRLGSDAQTLSRGAPTEPLVELRSAVRQVRTALTHADGIEALWLDVVCAYRDATAAPSTPFLRLRQLRESVEAAGHDFRSVGLRVAVALADSGAPGTDDTGPPLDNSASRSLGDRIEQAGQHLTAPVGERPVPVWLAFGGASLPESVAHLGPLTLVSAGWLQRQFDNDIFTSSGLLATGWSELAALQESRGWFASLPQDCVLVRMSVEGTSVEAAAAKARALVTDLVSIANEASEWCLFDGHLAWAGGTLWNQRPPEDPRGRAPESRYLHRAFEPTADSLTEFPEAFVRGLARGDEHCLEAFEDARWVVTSGRLSAVSQRVSLGLRALERLVALDDSHGEEKTFRVLFAPWFYLQLGRLVQAAAFSSYGGFSLSTVWRPPAEHEPLAAIHDLVMPSTGPGSRSPSPRGLASLSPAQLALMPRGSDFRRIACEGFAVLNDWTAALRFVHESEETFKALRARAQRLRNEALHERRPSDMAFASVDQFIKDLARFAAREAIAQASTSGGSSLRGLGEQREMLGQHKAALARGRRPLDVFFPSTDDAAHD